MKARQKSLFAGLFANFIVYHSHYLLVKETMADKVKFIEKKDNVSNNDLGSTSHSSSLSHDNGEKGITNEYGFKIGENPKLPINKITKEQFDSLNGKSEKH